MHLTKRLDKQKWSHSVYLVHYYWLGLKDILVSCGKLSENQF